MYAGLHVPFPLVVAHSKSLGRAKVPQRCIPGYAGTVPGGTRKTQEAWLEAKS
jgi:hypothetical protein